MKSLRIKRPSQEEAYRFLYNHYLPYKMGYDEEFFPLDHQYAFQICAKVWRKLREQRGHFSLDSDSFTNTGGDHHPYVFALIDAIDPELELPI